MRSLSQTIAHLATLRESPRTGAPRSTARLQPLADFGTNPGNLDAWVHVPNQLGAGAPLVVVLHGCTQDAASYDLGSGWSQLADELGFAVLYPEQRRANNANRCFNWFEPSDLQREGGEPQSIVQMIDTLVQPHSLDRSQIYITGLSAGGAMTAVLLATYPEIFSGGAIIAGLPYGTATNVQQALQRMRGQGGAGIVRGQTGSAHVGPWPTISIWHGNADHVVVPSNANDILRQWQAIHTVPGNADLVETVNGHAHRVWHDAQGRAVIEDYRIAGMGHGTPLATGGAEPIGKAGPHMLEAGISSTRRIAAFWGLGANSTVRPIISDGSVTESATPATKSAAKTPTPMLKPRPTDPVHNPAANGVGKVIEDALRAAGLMR